MNGQVLNPKKSLKSQLFVNFIIPILLLGGMTFGFVKLVTGSIIDDHVLPQFEQVLLTNGQELVRSIEPNAVREAIENPSDNHANLINTLDSFIEGQERLEYAYVLTKQGENEYIVALSGSEDVMVESPFTDEQNEAFQTGDTVVTSIYEDEWGVHKSVFMQVDGMDAIVGVDMSTSFIGNLQKEINGFLAVFLAVAVLLGAGFAYFFGTRLTKAVRSLLNSVNRISDGDLTENIDTKRKDEIGQLSMAMNEMVESLRTLVQRVASASSEVSAQSEELTQSANEVKEGSEQVASTMQELSSGAESQADSSSSLSEVMDSFVRRLDEADESGKAVSTTSKEVLAMTEEGKGLMEASVQQMTTINGIVKESVERVHGLDRQSKEINKLVQVIQDIAEQTNLLSLNAAIEAARAGEHGKGFAVVADEVRKLAEQVSTSIIDITSIVDSIQSESNRVAQSLESGYEEVDRGTKQIEVTGETFHRIHNSVSDMSGRVGEISNHLSDIAVNSQQMNQSIEEIAAVSEESAAGVEQVAASSQQTTSSMEEVSHSARQLSELSEQLNDEIQQFKL
ncbi:HAMP domain-containing protein [Halobacillus litoralis]|uniref:HAMP domain-containing protein n=1 Tax=Halobacillus litoralis TaxID=45668 RepID=A0A845DTW1_9BACI|nr:methyl-accepting chemotaxis protein [Halobacillus litoralis]MYL20920.1 HAMP domain-containing protein [Halobacillus litoralis]MYL36239.1 HAMP domain-containing protein [Halobacillus litoralis]